MLEEFDVSLLCEVEDPGCLWGRIVKGPDEQAESFHQYENLQAKMNLFYHEVNQDVQKIKPATLEKGQLIVVFCPALRSWCRATVESLFMGTVDSQVMCFLVDHGERVVISTDDVRAPLEKFLQLPFRVRKFELARIHPMRLKVSISSETAELVPSSHWDISATKYLHNLLQVSTLVEAVLCKTNAGCTAIELYLTIKNVKICVNDDLVVKKFACFSSEKAVIEDQSDSVDWSPVSLAWDIFSSPQQILAMNGCCTVRSASSHLSLRNQMPKTSWLVPGKSFVPIQLALFLLFCVGVLESVHNSLCTVLLLMYRLLQLLNPDPLNSDSEYTDDNVVYCEPSRRGILVHSAIAINPCSSLSHAPVTEQFRKFLLRRKYSGPGLAESFFWPPVARGCDTVMVCHNANDPLSYMPPLLAQLQLASVFNALTTYTGPIAVILCPGWEKVQIVLDLLEESQTVVNLHPAAVLLGLGKDEAKNAKIQKNCQLLVTTPFSLARLLGVHCFLFLRLCHLVLDEASELFSRAPDQVRIILRHFQEVVSKKERAVCPRQIITVSNHWSRELEGMVREYMISPCIIVTVPEEAAVYGSVHQMILLCLDCNKTSVLLSSLDFSPSVPQKTLVITNSAEEVEHVYKAVSNTAAFSLKAHERLTHQFDFVIEQWKKDIGAGTQVILVTTNDCMKALGIRDATCVVHYGFPSSPKLFGIRLFCMSENFQNLSNKVDCAESSSPVVRSVLLLSERNARHVSGVLRYLKRTGTPLPPELLQFAQGVQQAKEEQKIDRGLCSHLRSLGFCRDSMVCPDRHTVNKTLDFPLHPDSGTVLVLPLYIKHANVYYGRIVNQKEDRYKDFADELNSHYAKERLCAKEVVKGGFYAIQEDDAYHRVCVIKVPEKGDQLFNSVIVHYIDEGRKQEVKSHQLLQLPLEFQSFPGQAVEIILCRIKPIDGEMDWNPRVTRAISLKIKGKIHQAKVVMCLGNSVWVDPMIHMIRVPGLKTFINEYNVHTEILATGMGTTNPQHLELLKTLCQREEASAAVSLEQRFQAAEEALASRMKAGIVNLCSGVELTAESRNTEPCEPSEELNDLNQITIPKGASSKDHVVPDEHIFHPQIKWFQSEESVTLKVKLINAVMQKCEFFTDRVLYSAYVNNQHYCANLELHSDINTEQCLWEIKCNEPVIQLVKKEKGEWKSLLKYKACFCNWFLANTGEEGSYVTSESGSESD
uniref:RNA helicase n=1 Tax=Pygocentrus nattereri TaxID=42514 RepID=A0AAR2LIF5_PYGNA